MTDFNDRIAALAERHDFLSGLKQKSPETLDIEDWGYLDCSENALPLLREMAQALSEAKAENVGLKGQFLDHAETDSYLRMVKYAAHVKDLYRWEKEQKEAAQAENDRLKADAERTDKAFSKALKDLVLAKRESKRFGNQVVLAVNKGCELQAENQRLREGIGRAVDCLRRDCESFGELSSAVCDAQEQLEALHDA